MKIAIHKSNWGFSPDWIKYCQEKGIPHKIVNCYDSDIIQQLEDCEVLLWHHHHIGPKDIVFAKQLLFALEQSGKKVFPNFNTGWHFDDKLGQKYLLEAIHAPLVKTDIFYSKAEALNFINNTTFPIVFKLRGGAGSSNVKLVKTKKQASKLVDNAFGRGFPAYDRFGNLKETWMHFKRIPSKNYFEFLKSIRRFFVSTAFAKVRGKEKGYVIFQEFIPNNSFDVRVVVIGERAFAIKRLVRKNDFRASGSGLIEYDKERIDVRCVKIAFEVTQNLNAQCVAFDFVFDQNNSPLIVEINYGFAHDAYFKCPGWWDKQLIWNEGKFNSAEWIVELLLSN